jgi:hypothetical protein
MKTKTSLVFGIIAIVAAVLLFAAGPLAATHQAYACGFGGFGGCCGCFSCCGGFGGWGW